MPIVPYQPQPTTCRQCAEIIAAESRFCKHCGVLQTVATQHTIAQNGSIIIQHAAFFYGIEVIICGLASFITEFKTLVYFLVFDALLAVNTIGFFAGSWQINKLVLRWPNFSFQKLCAYGAIALTGSLLVHYSVTWLNQTIFSKDYYYVSFFEGSKYYALLLILFTAVLPALFEELAFRGYLLNKLLLVMDAQQAVFISSFLFAILHMSFISLFWLMPFALFLGYTRIKENTVWYGVFFHFTFNFGACLFDLL